MLNAMRRHATGWVVKVLFVLLIVSFAVWGIGDIFTGGGGSTGPVAEVAGSPIEQQELLRAFDNRYRDLQQQVGGDLTRQQAVSYGLLQQTLEAAVAQRLVDQHARDLGVGVATDDVARAIRDNAAFQGNGGFDRERLQLYLQSAGISEEQLVEAVRGDMRRQKLVTAITEPAAAPPGLAQRLLGYREERRRGRAAIVPADEIVVEPPGDEALGTYLESNAKAYEAPEYRKLTLVSFAAEDLLGEIEIDEAALRAEYEARKAELTTPATLGIEQLLAPDQANAQRAAEMARGGTTFEAVAATMTDPKVERSSLDSIREGDLPEALDTQAWSLQPGAIGDPVETPFGWHVIRVLSSTPEVVKGFEETRPDLERQLKLSRASDRLPGLATQLDDEIAAGTPLDEAAEKLGIPVTRIEAVDREGQSPQREAVAADRLLPAMRDEAFGAAQDETSLLQQTDDGRYYMVRVDGITPARPRGLDEVRDELVDAWTAAEQDERAKARAAELRSRVATAEMLATVTAEFPDVRVRPIDPLKRDDQGFLAGLRPAAVEAMFKTEAGAVATEPVPVLDGWAVIGVDEILPAGDDPGTVEKVREEVANGFKSDLLQAYEAALRARYPVEVDQDVIAQMMQAQVR